MSHSQIIRLRGDARALVWSEGIERLIAQSAALRTQSPHGAPADHPDGTTNSKRFRPSRAWEAKLEEAQDAAAHAFGEAQRWRLGRSGSPRLLLSPSERRRAARGLPPWSVRDDCYEHPDFFYIGRRLAAVVVHLYPRIALDALPRAVVVDCLPASWYNPGLTTAYVLRPDAFGAALRTELPVATPTGRTEYDPT